MAFTSRTSISATRAVEDSKRSHVASEIEPDAGFLADRLRESGESALTSRTAAPDSNCDEIPERIRLNIDADASRLIYCMPTLDVREIPPVDRHTRIHDEFDGMDAGDTLTIINDHEPKPLYYEMAAEVASFDEDGYEVSQDAPDKFVAEFPKIAE